jgi:hypothetical protein
MSLNLTRAEFHGLGLAIDPGDPSKAVLIAASIIDSVTVNASFPRIASSTARSVSEESNLGSRQPDQEKKGGA